MPEMKFTCTPEGYYPWLDLELQCFMAFPEDERERNIVLATLVLDAVAKTDEAVSLVPTQLLRHAMQGRGATAARDAITAKVKGGTAAGQVLLDLLEAQLNGEVPRVGAAIENIVRERAKYTTYGGNVDSMRAVRSVEAARHEFRSAPHLWAALLVLQRKLPMIGDVRLCLETQPLLLVAIAMDLRSRVTGMLSDNGTKAKPIFDVESFWISPADLALPVVR